MKTIGLRLSLLLASLCSLIPLTARGAMVIDDAGRTVNVPDKPLRIVSLDDIELTLPLLELGVVPAASVGRLGKTQQPFVRSSRTLTGLDFDNTDMIYLGTKPADVETLAALTPDLILTLRSGPTPLEQLQKIAPTVVIDDVVRGPHGLYDLLSSLTGTQREFQRLERRYQAQLEQLRKVAGKPALQVSVIAATGEGKISVQHTYGGLGMVLREAGFRFPQLVENIRPGSTVEFSPEVLPSLDSDYIFDTYRNDRQELPEHAQQRLAQILPDYCQHLRACGAGRYYFLPRDEAKSTTYAARTMASAFLIGAISNHRVEQAVAHSTPR